MRIKVWETIPIPSTLGNVVYITYTLDKEGGYIIVDTAGSCIPTLIRIPHVVNTNSV